MNTDNALISHTASSCGAAMTAWAIEARMDAGSRSGNVPCWDQYNLVLTKNSKVLELQTEPAPGCILSTEQGQQDHAITEIHYCPPRELCAHRSTKVFTFKQLLTRTQFTEALGCFSNTVQLMTDTAVHSLQIFGSYSHIIRLAIYCYIETLKRHRKDYLPLTCNWVCPFKNTTKEDFIVPARRLSPKYGGGLGALQPLGSPRREFIPGERMKLQCQATAHRSSAWKSKSHPEGTSVYLNAFPVIPFYGPHVLGMLHSQETGRDWREVIPFRGL